jgi:hypothetical protein
MFEHFLITRFNLKLESHFGKDKRGNDTQTETWLKRRFELFNNYCFPSIQGQSCQDFKWLVLFDKNTLASHLNQIEEFTNKYPNFFPVYSETGAKEKVRKCLADAIHSLSKSKTPYILTTRIDNDDAFHKDLIREVQLYYKMNQVECFLNFNYGFQYDVVNCVAVKIRYENNHFLSLLEKKDPDLKTVIFHNHSHIQSISSVISVENKKNPMWMEVIHEMNVSNYLHLSKPVFSEKSLYGFNLDVTVHKKNTWYHWLKFVKKSFYDHLSHFFTRLGHFDQYKRIIRFCKSPFLR